MSEDNEESTGAVTFLVILLVAHVICWIASVVKAVIDRKAAVAGKKEAAKSKPLLAETRQKEKEEEEEEKKKKAKLTLMTEVNTHDGGAKFAVQSPKPQPISPNEHYFPKCPKRLLSTGGARRIGPEELATMLDNFDAAHKKPKSLQINEPPSPIPSPTRLPAKGITAA
ncbi:hypothetical protein Aperf_G00000096820 [Anoplocephala perfoliata]